MIEEIKKIEKIKEHSSSKDKREEFRTKNIAKNYPRW